MGHGGVADEIKGRGGAAGRDVGRGDSVDRRGGRPVSVLRGRPRAVHCLRRRRCRSRPRCGSDIALVFDECTPFHVSREYTERSMERTHRWLERCLRWHASQGRPGRPCTGSFREASTGCGSCRPRRLRQRLRRDRDRRVARPGQGADALGGRVDDGRARALAPDRPRHLLGIGDVDDLIAGVEMGIDTFDCALPTRLGRHGVALVPDPDARWRVDLVKGRWRDTHEPILDGCPCPACSAGFSRGYLHYLLRAGELTGAAPRDAPQPLVHRPADGGSAGGDRWGEVAVGGGRAPGWRGAGDGRRGGAAG